MKETPVVLLETEDSLVLIMRGEHTKETVINSAIAANEITEDDRATWIACDDIMVGYYKAVPKDDYATYYMPCNQDIKGAFLATCLTLF
ncbi:hypothetical protein EC835_11445 [Providencia alcalifaciens]|uniref:Uncharacterized protein n=1 Tax=Providencia alcalifaciens TaxID=126385 RepID=A0A4R3ND28_9GAMM|nr:MULTISPECIES: hypothetical protein [Providencia]MBC5792330.1 hypothetical protein [Providencia sp. JUb39]TCT28914.1 hypothetical protein EC835_11445 [Providencia alcalifaciens]